VPFPSASFAERLRSEGGRRTLAFALALLIEGLLLLVILSFAVESDRKKEERRPVTVEAERQAEEPAPPQPQQQPQVPQPGQAPPTPSVEPLPTRPAETVVPPARNTLPTETRVPPAATPPARGRIRPGGAYGPPSVAVPAQYRDSERVGTRPNGEPVYAASWYREPRDEDLRDYLSTAHGPGYGLIDCRTAPDYRVEDCVAVSEYPAGSQINRAILAAAWEFRVRPPRRGGRLLVGEWVRIRISYTIDRR
jgi:protein TonB